MGTMRQTSTDLLDRLSRGLAPDFDLMPMPLPDCPVFLAIACPRADGLTGLKPRLPAGRGMNPAAALIAAGAEAVELRASLAQSHMALLHRAPRRDGLAMVTAHPLAGGTDHLIPAQSVFLDAAATLSERLVHDADSTGCAAGQSEAAATTAALWECVERDAVALWWHGGQPAPPLPLALIDTSQPRLSWWLDRRDRQTRLYDLTTDLGLPVVAALSADADGRHVALGTAARPRIADAALAAVTELVQTEVGMDQARAAANPEVAEWDGFAALDTLPQTGTRGMSTTPDTSPALSALVQHLVGMGHPPLAVATTLPGDPLPSVRVLVPGLCAMRGRIDTPRFRRLRPDAQAILPEPF